MEHVVFFPAVDGSPSFRRVPSLDEAVRLVEHLRNAEGLSTVSVHSLAEVPLAFRAYYRVEVPGAAVASGPSLHQPVASGAGAAQPVPVDPPALAPVGLVLVEDRDAVEQPVPRQGVAAGDDAHDTPGEPALSTPASLGFFA